MGAVDLVDPGRVARSRSRAGCSAIGRAGHELGAVSKGRIFPKFRADLLESAVVAQADARGRDRGDDDPAQPARRARAADRRDLRRRGDRGRRPARARPRRVPVRRPLARRSSRTCSTCSPAATRPTSSPSCGRGSSGTAPAASIRGREGARRLAVTNAGTIPDRGLFGVFLVDGGGRVGELDEEMVYEARAGQTFLLGASTWRIEEITRDRVLVSPAPGVPGAVPFWKGEGVGRPYELGEAIGARLARARRARRRARRSSACRASTASTSAPPRNLLTYLREQAGGDGRRPVRPHDRRRALPRRDRRLARLHPHAVRRRACTRRGRWRSPRGCASRSGSRCSRSGRTTGSRSTCPTRTRRRRSRSCCIDAGRARGARRRGGRGRRRSSARASARTPRARC